MIGMDILPLVCFASMQYQKGNERKAYCQNRPDHPTKSAVTFAGTVSRHLD
jgi:hypothetical protein